MSGARETPAVTQALRISVIGSIRSQFRSAFALSLRGRRGRRPPTCLPGSLPSVSEHPWPSRRRGPLQGLRTRRASVGGTAAAGVMHVPATAASRMSRFVRTALVARPGFAVRRAHHGQSRCRGEAHRGRPAIGTRHGQITIRNAAQHVCGAVFGTMKFINRHSPSSATRPGRGAAWLVRVLLVTRRRRGPCRRDRRASVLPR